VKVGRSTRLLACGAAWVLLGALSPTPPTLAYDPSAFDDAPAPRPRAEEPPAAAPAPARDRVEHQLTIDFAAIADSNATNGTRLREVPVLSGDERVPVPLDPRLRQKRAFGRSAALSASLKVPVTPAAKLTLSGEAYIVDYPGAIADDAWVSAAAGVELGRDGRRTTLEAMLFDRWYAHETAMAGWGVRATHREPIATGQSLRAVAEARFYNSGYGPAFDGRQASLWLSYDAVLDPTLTASASVYARRDALRDRAYASTEVGGYGSLAHYLGPDLTGSASVGLARAWFDEPIPFLSTSSRADWRPWLALSLTTRRPLLWGFSPSLSYSFGRTFSTLPFYESDRHRLRLGVARTFR